MGSAIEIKICGLTNLDDATFAAEQGADYLGFVLYPKSPRFIEPRDLRRLAERLPARRPLIGVFVNETRENVIRIAADCGLMAVQIHGDEAAADFVAMPFDVWRAVHFTPGAYAPDPAFWPAARYVLDARAPGQYGGTGVTVDWTAAAAVARRYPSMLAGGLTPENVAAAIRMVRPAGVDVVSGVESAAGRKNRVQLARFIRAVRETQTG